MARTNSLRPLTAFFLLGLVPVGAACNGKVVSLGNTGDTLQPVTSVAKVSATPTSCPGGWAHPNVCCSGGPKDAPSCGTWEENPFRACEKGSTTYPNPLSCCSLSNPKDCSDTPNGGPIASPPPPFGCGYACPPGWWTQASGAITPGGVEGAMCCTTQPGGGTACEPQGGVNLVSTPPSVCAGSGGVIGPNGGGAIDAGPGPFLPDASPPPIDAGTPTPISGDAGVGGWVDDGGCPTGVPYGGYDGGSASLCEVCPKGWGPDGVQPELCCQDLSDGTRECFSQATGSASGIGGVVDAGVSLPPSTGGSPGTAPGSTSWGSGGARSPDGGSTGPSCTGSAAACSCDHTVNGSTYALDCYVGSSGAITCSCSIDGKVSGSATVTSCQDSTSVESAYAASGCGFP